MLRNVGRTDGPGRGSTDFVAPAAGGYTFTGQGSGNTLDLSAVPAGATVTLNGDSPASPGIVANLNSGPGGSTSDEFSDLTVNQAAQSVSFIAPATGTVGGLATLTATGGASGNPVVFSVDPTSGAGVCAVSGTKGTTVNYAAAGNCVLDANQAGCARHGNVYTWMQASLGDGASAQFSITVKASRAGLATVLAVAASQSPDHEPLNNISLQLITIKR